MNKNNALDYHSMGRKGKIEVISTKPCQTAADLSLAYSPGVAEPCLAIEKNPDDAYKYTAKGNLVAVVSNGTAVLGLGNLGALAGKPVMEGKGVLFKRFADIDVFDIELNTENPDEIIKACQLLEPTFGGINLEDIKAPECFYIEEELKKTMNIPVFHDDQHGTAIISSAALINALELIGKKIGDIRIVVNGAGASAIACANLAISLGVKKENLMMCDTKGVIYKGRAEGMNKYKARFAVDTKLRTLEEAAEGADVLFGLSSKEAFTPEMVRKMAANPIIFAMANPDPEITPDEARAARGDVIIATGRSDYPNHVNNVLGFPFIFRGALDVRATSINEEMKLAAVKALDMAFQPPLRAQEAENFDFFLKLPDVDATQVKLETLSNNQLVRPLFEFSGACAGCGETPYLKLLTQLFGDRMIVANATGCSSIYGGNLPTTPYAQRADGRGPAWSNSLFEDNAEFGFGMRLTVDQFTKSACEYLTELAENKAFAANATLFKEILSADQSRQAGIEAQRGRVEKLKAAIKGSKDATAKLLLPIADYLVKKSVWCIGGDGWAYDIGFGGLDHVIASGKNINLFVLDTEVYSNTGGQASKSTPLGSVGFFAAGGKPVSKKDLGMMAMSYGSVYVAQVSLSNPAQCVKAMLEAEAYDGPSIIIAYAHCIAHGINMTAGVDAQRMAVQSGHWPLYRYNPALAAECKNPLQLDSKEPTITFEEHANNENRFRMLKKANPAEAEALMKKASQWARAHFAYYQKLASLSFEDS